MLYHRQVLIAEDQSTARGQLQEIFRHTGCTILGECRNTDDMLEKFERLQPDLIVVDVTLPGTHDALVAIKRMKRVNPDVAIFATGMTSQDNILMEALTMGAMDFFTKPFQARSIHNCLQRNIG